MQCKLIKFPSLKSPVKAFAARGMGRAAKSLVPWFGGCEPVVDPPGQEAGRAATVPMGLGDTLVSPDLGIARRSRVPQAALGARPAPPLPLPSPAKGTRAMGRAATRARVQRSWDPLHHGSPSPACCAQQGSSGGFFQHLPADACCQGRGWQDLPPVPPLGAAPTSAASLCTAKHQLLKAGQHVVGSALKLKRFPDSPGQRQAGKLVPSSPQTLKHPEEWCHIPKSPGV